MNQETFLKHLEKIHQIFEQKQSFLNTLHIWIGQEGKQREMLDHLLTVLGLPLNEETRFIASARIGQKKFEPLDIYLERTGATQETRDQAFEISYTEVRKVYESLQKEILDTIKQEDLLGDFYRSILDFTHSLWILYSDLFLVWNRRLLFGVNRDLEKRFQHDQEKIMKFLRYENLFDMGHHGREADRSYSVLKAVWDSYISESYAQAFPEQIEKIVVEYDHFLETLETLEDPIFHKKAEYIVYFRAIQTALQEKDCNSLVERWAQVDTLWMDIDTPIQPGHPIEYYDDKYRRAVAIEFDLRISDPSLFRSQVAKNIENMYEAFFDEIGRENFPESYQFSLNNQKKVGLYIWAPVLAYGSFLCGAYSAQVIPNDPEVSRERGKKIFAFPKFVLHSQKGAPKMKLDQEMIEGEILKAYDAFLQDEQKYYEVYDIEIIGHEFWHTLWLSPDTEITMNMEWLFKNIEEFKATAGWLVAYFLSGGNEFLDKEIIVTHVMRSIRMLRYREVEDILPYYCECLIHLHILFESKIIKYHFWKIELNFSPESYTACKEGYMAVYTQQIFSYLHRLEAGNFLFEYVEKIDGVYLPKDAKVRKFVEEYYTRYKEIGNEVV